MGRRVFVGPNSWLADQFPECVSIEGDITLAFADMPAAPAHVIEEAD